MRLDIVDCHAILTKGHGSGGPAFEGGTILFRQGPVKLVH